MTLKPIPVRVLRHACPHCGRTHSRPGRAREHMARCWFNPEARGCKTCKHFEAYGPEWGDNCGKDVDLSGRPACTRCGGANYVPTGEIFRPRFAKPGRVMAQCPECGGDGAERKAGPIVGCGQWEIDPERAEAAS